MKKLHIVLFLLVCVFIFFGWKTIDPDFGWRIRVGQLILNQGIPHTDPFSFTMMNYPFIDFSWLTHICIFLIYGLTNNSLLLSLIFGFIAVLSLYEAIFVEKKKDGWFVPALAFLIGSSLFGVIGIRPQIWGWLLFMFWVNELRKGSKASFSILCLMQLIWVNIHGSFFLGVGTFILYIISEYIQKKEIKKHIGKLVVLFCITMINPYGWRLWREIVIGLSDSQLHLRNQEWISSIFVLNISFWFYCTFFFSLFIRNWKHTSLFEKFLSLFFFSISLSTVRNMPLFVLVSAPLCVQMWFRFENSVTKEMKKYFFLFKNTLIILFFFIGFARIGNGIAQIKPINKVYPVDAVSFLIGHKAQGRIYSEYEWGGYLIWKMPALKVFIDGRMMGWMLKQNDPKQSDNTTKEYFIIKDKHPSFEPYRRKYNITYALIRKDKEKNIFIKYKKIYEDELSIVYKL